jgi:hypothetical protein
MLAVKLFSKYPRVGGTLRADWSLVHQGLVITTGPRGFEECSFFVPMDRGEARTWYGRSGATHIQVSENGRVVYEGRVEVVSTIDGPLSGLAITALGYWRAFSDAPINTEWSTGNRSRWQPIETAQLAGRVPDEWNFTTDDKVMISAVSGGVFDSSRGGATYFTFGNTVSKTIQTLDAAYSLTAPTGWIAFIQAFTGPFTGASNVWTLAGNGATQTGTIALSSLAAHTISMLITRNRAATTLGTAIAAGTRTVTPGSISGIAVGNKLWIGGTEPEEVEVTAVVGATFTAVFRYAHAAADVVSFVSEHKEGDIRFELTAPRIKATNSSTVTASEVLTQILTDINASNPGHISASTALVGNPGVDLKEFQYDGYPDAVIDQLATMGDASGNVWTAEVYEDQVLRFRREDSITAVYQIMQTPELSRDLDLFRSHLIPRYQDANGDVAQGTTQANLIAASRAGVVRSAFFEAPEVDSVATVNALAATALLDTVSPAPMGDITVTELLRNGVRVPLHRLRKGDIVECVEFPSSGSQAVDDARRLRVSATSYDHDAQTLTISPTLPASTIEALLARRGTQGAIR